MADFTQNGCIYRLIPTDEWTWVDARRAKAASGGMTSVEIGRRAAEGDPDALIALQVVSILRERTTATVETIAAEIEQSGAPMLSFVEEIQREREADDAVPPEVAAEEAATPSATTPDPSGDPSSDT